MLRIHDDKQIRMEFVSIEELVPQDHLLRKIERVVDFSFRQLRVLEQCLLAAVCQNLKKMALLHEREENGDQKGLWRAFFLTPSARCWPFLNPLGVSS